MRFADFPFLRYLPFILIGILWGQSSWSPGLLVLSIILGILWLFYLILVSNHKPRIQPSSLAYLALIFLGAVLVQNKQHQTDFSTEILQAESYLAEVTMYDQQKPNSFENLLEVKSLLTEGEWDDAQGKVLVYHQSEKPLEPGQIILVRKKPEEIASPLNPYEFDYRLYLSRQGINYRQFLGKDFHIVDSTAGSGFDYFLVNLRHKIGEMMKAKIPDENSSQIALALLLGQKKELDPTIREAYTQAGVMHILAVSGLHVGIIYALFILMLKPLKLKIEKARIYLLCVILVIWLYAFLTGLSPSVVRASTMFSLLTLGQMRERRPSIYNILAFSAILMITINPDVIYEVGFQLSYLAVLGIVMIQPLILNLWLPRYKALEYIWQLTSVSLAAQLVTFPLSLYYFHVFPTYFLLGNLLILPLAFLIMQVGVPLMIFGWIPVLGDGLGWILSWLIWGQNWIAETIRLIPGGKLDRLTMDFSGMIFVWGLLLVIAGWEFGSKRKLTWLALSLAFLWAGFQIYGEVRVPAKELIVYQGKKSQILDFSDSGEVYSWNQGLEPGEISYSVDPNRIQNRWPHTPKSFDAFLKESGEIDFVGTDFTFHPKDRKLHFFSTPKSVQFWSEGKWTYVSISDSLVVDSLAYRILF
ncbi:ComEC/Rec2 family competence protein [Algoriphagus sp. D3-2-R+10]|uniref:ComEC/Rec2 family competence protein n=1 Tax=Algoriphagus aurantiacus TaxID=3103948 RepID=UPI002B37D8AE|nr:ComEC/Rec2 family competence protein [Algoriphagus sp. D3-2-R+10]MEB2774404.1 ComEC/Rec2 family competence protein [Algoriphagus sp. D3-2-R+10]